MKLSTLKILLQTDRDDLSFILPLFATLIREEADLNECTHSALQDLICNEAPHHIVEFSDLDTARQLVYNFKTESEKPVVELDCSKTIPLSVLLKLLRLKADDTMSEQLVDEYKSTSGALSFADALYTLFDQTGNMDDLKESILPFYQHFSKSVSLDMNTYAIQHVVNDVTREIQLSAADRYWLGWDKSIHNISLVSD